MQSESQIYQSIGNLPHAAGIDNGMVPSPEDTVGGKSHIKGIHHSKEGYRSGVFVPCGSGKNYKLVQEPYGAFSISAAVRGPYQRPPPGGNCRCGNACGCNCAHGGGCKCPYLSGVS